MLDTVKLTYLSSNHTRTCFMTKKQAKYYGLNQKKGYVTLILGSLKINLKKVIVDNNDLEFHELCLSEDLKKSLYIPEDVKLQIKKGILERLIIGPFIGIFINTLNVPYLSKGYNFDVYEQFDDACKSLN